MRRQCALFAGRCVAVVAILGTIGPALRAVETGQSALTAADRKAITWFDTLGFPDLAKKPCVRVATGMSSRRGKNPPENAYRIGFLLEDKTRNNAAGDFTVFLLNLSTETFRRTKPGTPEARRVGYEAADLKAAADAELAELRKPSREFDLSRRFGERLSERGEVFVLARACAAHGLDASAHDLIAEAAKMPINGMRQAPGAALLLAALSDEIAHNRMWEAVVAFGEPSIGRKELLERFRYIVKHFPESKHAEEAKNYVDLIAQMVDEDEEHDRLALKPLSQMTLQEQAVELVFRLRDQNGHQWMQPGRCDLLDDLADREGKNPAHQLVALGFDAVPPLIEALDYLRFTRSVGYWRNFVYSHHVLRVGDCADEILSRIAGRSFDGRRSTSSPALKDGEESPAKKEARQWWAAAQKKGEKQMLIEGLAAGGFNAYYRARRLAARYPDDALGPIVAAMKNAIDGNLRESLLGIVCKMPGDASTGAIDEEMRNSSDPGISVTAARELLQRGRKDAIPAMIANWNRLNTRDSHGTSPAERMDDDKIEPLTAFLAHCDDPAAVGALAKHLGKQDVGLRVTIIRAFASDSDVRANKAAAESSKIAMDAVERLLATALDDTEPYKGMSRSMREKPFMNRRVCDVAAYVLAQRFPNKYSFNLSAPLRDRERQRLAMIETWRKQSRP